VSVVGFKARNHPQQVRSGKRCPAADDRRTPREWWEKWSAEFGPFTLDAAASHENALCKDYYTVENCGLSNPWRGRVWVNPPYSGMSAWVDKAWTERESGRCQIVCMLAPANRTEQRWWQERIEPFRDGANTLFTRFLPGRLRFGLPVTDPRGDRPPFGCVLIVWA
jgi:phage N-6-adenine-methyltransferase